MSGNRSSKFFSPCVSLSDRVRSFARNVWSAVTPARVCVGVGFIFLLILIVMTRDVTTTSTTTASATSTKTTTASRTVVYFEATRDSSPSHKLPSSQFFQMDQIPFEDIPVNRGGGMMRNGSFVAPVAGVYRKVVIS